MTTLYGIIGRPLAHSFSPTYFNQKFQRENINARYCPFELQNIKEVEKLLRSHPDLLGFNVTIPYKQAILPYLHRLTPTAAAIGAVNCVRVLHHPDGHPLLVGHNTDAPAFLQSLLHLLTDTASFSSFPTPRRPHPPTPVPTPHLPLHALILGNGGAARAIRYALDQLHIHHLTVTRSSGQPDTIPYSALTPTLLSTHHLLINATPLGTWPRIDDCPPLPYHLLTPHHLLHDLVYNPPLTTFMHLGLLRGTRATNGLLMLHLQAQLSWDFWQSPLH